MEMEVVKTEGSESTALIRLAIDKGIDTDKLEKLIELRNREIDRQSQADFESAFSRMQAEFIAIVKDKAAKDNSGKTMYTYAPLETLQEVVGPTIAKHGFSYAWREENIETGKRVIMSISGYGHTKTTSFDVPKIDGTNRQNAVQAAGAMSTYGRRYTFIAGFGLTVKGEDDDAVSLTFDDGVRYAEYVRRIKECKTLDDLKSVWPIVYKELDGDNIGREIVGKAKDAKKKELTK